MSLRLAALLLASAAVAAETATAAQIGAVRRGDIIVRVSGTVVPEDVFRLKSMIEGRVESVAVSSDSWRTGNKPLATLVDKELAAMIDVRGGQNEDLLEARWAKMYRPTPVRCPDDCYVLKVYAKAHEWVKPQAVLFEAASRLKLVGRVRPETAAMVRDGMALTFWDVNDPKRRLIGKVANYDLDVRNERVSATFSLDLTPERSLKPGTEWEGEIVPLNDVEVVPTSALIVHDGVSYLPVRVSTGLTTSELTQITGGVEDSRPILILDDAALRGEPRHVPSVDRATIDLRRHEQDAAAPKRPSSRADGTDEKTQTEPRAATGDGKDYEGEDPYGEQ